MWCQFRSKTMRTLHRKAWTWFQLNYLGYLSCFESNWKEPILKDIDFIFVFAIYYRITKTKIKSLFFNIGYLQFNSKLGLSCIFQQKCMEHDLDNWPLKQSAWCQFFHGIFSKIQPISSFIIGFHQFRFMILTYIYTSKF